MDTATTAASLPAITSEFWVLQTESIAHKAELFAYADSVGLPINNNCPDDNDRSIGVWEGKLLAYFHDFNPDGSSWNEQYAVIDAEQFRAMCDAYAQPSGYSRTGPPAKHGVRDLLLGLVAALLLSAALPGCATPERLTGVAPHKLNYSDARTKHAEPGPSHLR